MRDIRYIPREWRETVGGGEGGRGKMAWDVEDRERVGIGERGLAILHGKESKCPEFLCDDEEESLVTALTQLQTTKSACLSDGRKARMVSISH